MYFSYSIQQETSLDVSVHCSDAAVSKVLAAIELNYATNVRTRDIRITNLETVVASILLACHFSSFIASC